MADPDDEDAAEDAPAGAESPPNLDPEAISLRLPTDLRDAFKRPFGPVYTDASELLAHVSSLEPLVAVGDVVTAHLQRAGRTPDVAVVDGRTEREAVDEAIAESLPAGERRIEVANPPARISGALLLALREALDAEASVVIVVDGEEDLATLPAAVAAPDGASVVYGQPGEGMVHVRVDRPTRNEMRRLLRGFDGDVEAALALVAPS